MKYLPILLISLSLFPGKTKAQELDWAYIMGGTNIERGWDIAADQDGNVYSTGVFTSATDFDPGIGVAILSPQNVVDIYIQKVDSDGVFQWVTHIASTDEILAGNIQIGNSGSIYLAGTFRGTVDFDPGTGTVSLTSNGFDDAFFLKLNNAGEFIWVRRIGSDNADYMPQIVLDTNENLYTTGYITSGTADIDPGPGTKPLTAPAVGASASYVLKLDKSGNTSWVFPLEGNKYCTTLTIALDETESNIYITGGFADSTDFDPGPNANYLFSIFGKEFILKIDSNSNLVWVKTFMPGQAVPIKSMTVDLMGNLLISGTFRNTVDFDIGSGVYNLVSKGFDDVFILKMNRNAEFIWAVSMGSPSDEYPHTLQTDKNGNVYSTGTFYGSPDFDPSNKQYKLIANTTYNNAYIWKLSAYGTLIWAHKVLINGYQAAVYGFVVDHNKNLIGTGSMYGNADMDPSSNTYTLSGGAAADDILLFKWSNECTATSTSTILVSACSKYTVPSTNETYTASGTYMDTIGNMNGCDSIITINLTIIPPTTSTISIETCTPFTVPSGDETYAVSGTYKDTIPNSTGCDSIITINLTISGVSRSNITASACESYTVPSGDETYTTSGTYSDTIPSSAGCDSVITIELTITTISATVSNSSNTLTASPAGAQYKWIDCATNQPISGQTAQSFTPIQNGSYAVVVSQNGCSDTSACEPVTTIEIKEFQNMNLILAPNPFSDYFTISGTNSKSASLGITIQDATGRVVFMQELQVDGRFEGRISLKEHPVGIFFLELKMDGQTVNSKILKQ